METCGNMRALLLAGAAQYDELFMGLKTLEVAFQNSVKDLRSQVKKRRIFFNPTVKNKISILKYFCFILKNIIIFQVVREACITIAYMSQMLRLKVDRFLEALMQNLINLIPNSAKIMSTSGIGKKKVL